jgi:lysozyme
MRYCLVLAPETEGRLAAIVDFTFNLRTGQLQMSTMRRRINQRDWSGTGVELRRWIYAGGRILPGLVARRESERVLLS